MSPHRLALSLTLIALPFLVALGCSSGAEPTTGSTGTGGAGGSAALPPVGGEERPVEVYVPDAYKEGTPAPLVVLLHGYGASGTLQDAYFQLKPLAEKHGFLYAFPDGTVDPQNKHFWNATDACCNFGDSKVDDSAYLARVVDDIKARYSVDPKRVYYLGHSNGGFMSYRMACDHADTIAAIASLAGAMFADVSKCTPKEPVAVLQIHGTADSTINYTGDQINGVAYPGALQSVEAWANFNGCAAMSEPGPDLDLESSLSGAETNTQIFSTGCKPGGHAELWSIKGGGHIPSLSSDFAPKVIEFLLAHPKP